MCSPIGATRKLIGLTHISLTHLHSHRERRTASQHPFTIALSPTVEYWRALVPIVFEYAIHTGWGGGNELGECFFWREVVEGDAGTVARFVGDGAQVGLMAGNGGIFGQVAARGNSSCSCLLCLSQGLWGAEAHARFRWRCPNTGCELSFLLLQPHTVAVVAPSVRARIRQGRASHTRPHSSGLGGWPTRTRQPVASGQRGPSPWPHFMPMVGARLPSFPVPPVVDIRAPARNRIPTTRAAHTPGWASTYARPPP